MMIGVGESCRPGNSPKSNGTRFNINPDSTEKARNVLGVTPGLTWLVAGYLLFGLAACGAPVSEKAPGQGPSANTRDTTGGTASVGTALNQKEQQKGQAVAESSGSATGNSAGREAAQAHLIPEIVAQSLDSPDARARLTALDHWNVKGGNAPLDPVFEALEDEDEDVREKATAIVEQRWAEEQKREQG